MTDEGILTLMEVFVLVVNVVTAPFTLRAGRRWNAASQGVIVMLLALMLWGRTSQQWNTLIAVVLIVLVLALAWLTFMSLRELRREMYEPR